MSKFSVPGELIPKAMIDDAVKQTTAMMPAELASAVNLMAHPLAGASAMTALGVGFASQAMGMWLGAMSGAAAASQRLFMPMLEQAKKAPEEFRDATRTAEMRAVDTASALIADTKAEVAQVVPIKHAEPRSEAETRRDAAPKEPEVKRERSPRKPEAKERSAAERPAAKPVHASARGASARSERASERRKPSPRSSAETKPRTPRRAAVAKSIPADKMHEEVAPKASRKPATVHKPKTPDDLKEISGIGPKLEQVLNSQGIWTFKQIAGWSRNEVERIEDIIGMKGRIIRDSWIPQASKLAKAK